MSEIVYWNTTYFTCIVTTNILLNNFIEILRGLHIYVGVIKRDSIFFFVPKSLNLDLATRNWQIEGARKRSPTLPVFWIFFLFLWPNESRDWGKQFHMLGSKTRLILLFRGKGQLRLMYLEVQSICYVHWDSRKCLLSLKYSLSISPV